MVKGGKGGKGGKGKVAEDCTVVFIGLPSTATASSVNGIVSSASSRLNLFSESSLLGPPDGTSVIKDRSDLSGARKMAYVNFDSPSMAAGAVASFAKWSWSEEYRGVRVLLKKDVTRSMFDTLEEAAAPEDFYDCHPLPDDSGFHVGQAVQCRDGNGRWKDGIVRSVQPLKVEPNGWDSAHQWDEVRSEIPTNSTSQLGGQRTEPEPVARAAKPRVPELDLEKCVTSTRDQREPELQRAGPEPVAQRNVADRAKVR